MTKTTIAKTVAKTVVGHCVGATATIIIRNNVTAENPTDKVKVFVGSFAMGMMAAKAAEAWTDEAVDKTIEAWKSMTSKSA